jgi:hypothetical protein
MAERRIMAQRNRIPGTYEIWRQHAGQKPKLILSIHSQYEVKDLMSLFMEDERDKGLWAEGVDGGFISYYVHKRKPKNLVVPVTHYWVEEVMPDDVPIDTAVKDWLAVAAATAAAEVREQEQAAADDFRRDAE